MVRKALICGADRASGRIKQKGPAIAFDRRPGKAGLRQNYQRKTTPADRRRLFCRLFTVSLSVVKRYSACTSRTPICFVALKSMPPPEAIANELSEPNALPEEVCAPPKSDCTNGVNLPIRKLVLGPNMYV